LKLAAGCAERHRRHAASDLRVGRGLKRALDGQRRRVGAAASDLRVGRGLKPHSVWTLIKSARCCVRPSGWARIETFSSQAAVALTPSAASDLRVGRGLKPRGLRNHDHGLRRSAQPSNQVRIATTPIERRRKSTIRCCARPSGWARIETRSMVSIGSCVRLLRPALGLGED